MKLTTENVQRREALSRDGYFVVPQVLGKAALDALQVYCQTLLVTPSAFVDKGGSFKSPDYRHPVMVNVLTHPGIMDILAGLGYQHPKLHSSFFTVKPPHSDTLDWHRDIYYPDPVNPASRNYRPTELFLLHYLTDTTIENGCLRVVPGSHRQPQGSAAEHDLGMATLPDEENVPMQAGDLLIADRNILHATHANTTDAFRIGLTTAIAPDYARLPEPIQARIVQNPVFAGWWPDLPHTVDPRLQAILPTYNGTATAAPFPY